DFVFALLNRGPVQLARVHAFDAEFLRVFQVVPQLGVEQQGFGRNAAYVQAGAAKEAILFDQRGFQSPLTGADRRRVTRRATADDGDIVDGFRQSSAPYQ